MVQARQSQRHGVRPSNNLRQCDRQSRSYASEDTREGDTDRSERLLPELPSAKRAESNGLKNNARHSQRAGTFVPVKQKPTPKQLPRRLTLLDEQVLVLCRSAIERSWGARGQVEDERKASPRRKYGHESIYAATQIQRLFRAFRTRCILAQANGPRFQRAAKTVQFALRRVIVARRVFRRWMFKRHRNAARIQAWFRGIRCRDMLLCEKARFVNERIRMFQRRFRGYRFWNLVAALLHRRRAEVASQIQRCCRGMLARRRVRFLREERRRFALELRRMSDIHRFQSRCDGCRPGTYDEASFFTCFMARFIGLHDYAGAKTLGEEGVRGFPSSARFSFMYAVLLQAMGEDMEISMAFLKRAQAILSISTDDITEFERRFLYPALQLCKDDIAVLLDMAIISQCLGNVHRAQSFYRQALKQAPVTYAVPGYLNRADMLDRILLNYHRFCSIFNSRQVNILAKTIPVAKRGEQVRVMVTRMSQYIVIYPGDDATACRFNTVYLTDEEVFQLLVEKEIALVKEEDGEQSVSPSVRDLLNWKGNNQRASVRAGSTRATMNDLLGGTKPIHDAKKDHPHSEAVIQRFQPVFLGLNVQPTKLARASEARSRLRITRGLAEKILRELVFVDADHVVSNEVIDATSSSPESGVSPENLCKVMMVPSIIKHRQLQQREFLASQSVIYIQRMFRAFRVRARFRRQQLLKAVLQQQVEDLYTRLRSNFMVRERRRLGAITMQRIYKGYQTRQRLAQWARASIEIQRVYRGWRGRTRAIAFREGNLTFYMAERVYQRGIRLRARNVMMIVDKCGLTFRLEAYDLGACAMYPGFISHDSTMALIRYENWAYAQRLCGREFWLHGYRGILRNVAFINPRDCQVLMTCDLHTDPSGRVGPAEQLVPLIDCINAINLRNAGLKGSEAEQLQLPITTEDTSRIVSCLVERLTLIEALPMATKELKKKTPGAFIVTVMPPPKVHFVFSKTGTTPIEIRKTSTALLKTSVDATVLKALAFPVVDGMRGHSVGTHVHRKKCDRHAIHFTKCRCVLPLVSTPAFVDTIALAMTPPPPPSFATLPTAETNHSTDYVWPGHCDPSQSESRA